MSVYIKAGTKIRDAVGHHVATVVHDIAKGDVMRSGDVEMVDGSKLQVGEMMPPALIEYLEGRRFEDQASK